MCLSGADFNSDGLSSVMSIITLVLIFIFIVLLAYFTTRFIARYQSNISNKRSNIHILESTRVCNNRFIAIAEICGNYYIIGIGREEITMLDKLDSETADRLKKSYGQNQTASAIDFKEILSRIRNKSVDATDTDDKDDTK